MKTFKGKLQVALVCFARLREGCQVTVQLLEFDVVQHVDVDSNSSQQDMLLLACRSWWSVDGCNWLPILGHRSDVKNRLRSKNETKQRKHDMVSHDAISLQPIRARARFLPPDFWQRNFILHHPFFFSKLYSTFDISHSLPSMQSRLLNF